MVLLEFTLSFEVDRGSEMVSGNGTRVLSFVFGWIGLAFALFTGLWKREVLLSRGSEGLPMKVPILPDDLDEFKVLKSETKESLFYVFKLR